MGKQALPDDERLDELSDDELICYASGNRHPWQLVGDYVEETNARGRMIVMRREWRCVVCPRRRAVFVNCIKRERGHYRYWTPGRVGPLVVGERPDSNALWWMMLQRTSSLKEQLK